MDKDVLFDILIRVDLSCLSNCILVCKDWSEVITEPVFRQKYINLWKVVGFFMYEYEFIDLWRRRYSIKDCPQVQFLPTTEFGCKINEWKTMAGLGYFISKSLDNGLILSGVHPHKFYVSSPIFGRYRRLPSPPHNSRFVPSKFMANILSDDPLNPSSFKVVIAETSRPRRDSLIIKTYSSSTREWVQSIVPTHFSLSPRTFVDTGTVTKGGVIYWKATRPNDCQYLAVYNTNNGNDCQYLAVYNTNNGNLSWIPGPMREAVNEHQEYGVSPQGFIRCAVTEKHKINHEKAWEEGMIKIWGLDDDASKIDWNLLYKVDFKTMWSKNSVVLEPLFEAGKPQRPFAFVSFVPGKGNSIYVGLGTEFFVYHFGTHRLERLPRAYEDGYGNPLDTFSSPMYGAVYHPVTMQELGVYHSLDRPSSWDIIIPRTKRRCLGL